MSGNTFIIIFALVFGFCIIGILVFAWMAIALKKHKVVKAASSAKNYLSNFRITISRDE